MPHPIQLTPQGPTCAFYISSFSLKAVGLLECKTTQEGYEDKLFSPLNVKVSLFFRFWGELSVVSLLFVSSAL